MGNYINKKKFIVIIDLPDEKWDKISDRYCVSNKGRVKYTIKGKERLVKIHNNGNGYLMVHMGGKKVYVHRIVALYFLKNPNNYKEVNHKDGIKSNNAAENLEWCNRSYNNTHAIRVLGNKRNVSGLTPYITLKMVPVKITHSLTGERHSFISIADAARYLNVSASTVYEALYRPFKVKKYFVKRA